MKQRKNFFVKNNTLNKGNFVIDEKSLERHVRTALPKPEFLAEYEALNPGITDKLLEMAKAEQSHEHKMEEMGLKMHKMGTRMGRICGLFVVLAICFFTTTMSAEGHIIYGLLFAIVSFGAMFLLSRRHKCNCRNCSCYNNNSNNAAKSYTKYPPKNPNIRVERPEEGVIASDKENPDDNKDRKYRGRNYNPNHRYKNRQQ